MKKGKFLPLTALAGGFAAFLLRTLQNRTGFEPDTGLPIPGNPYALGLIVLLAVLTVVFVLLARRLPEETAAAPQSFPAAFSAAAFSAAGAGAPALLVAGAFLLAGSGAYSLYSGALVTLSRSELVLGGLAILAAGCLLPVIAACRRQTAFNGNLLLAPVGFFVVRLVIQSRKDSINPTLEAYYPALLALVFLILTFYQLSSFAFGGGKTRRFAVCAAVGVVFCAAALADRPDFAALGLYGAGLLLQLGFLLLRLDAPAALAETTAPDSPTS